MNYCYDYRNNKKNLLISNNIKVLFTISIIVGVVVNFSNLLPQKLNNFLFIFSLFAGVFGIFLFLINERNIFKKDLTLFMIWLLLCVYMMLMGLLNFSISNRSFVLGTLISMDCRYVVYWGIGFLLAEPNYIDYYKKLMYFLGYLGTILGIIALIIYPYNIGSIQNRLGVWSMSYYLWWLPSSVFAYNFAYTRMTGKNKFVGYGSYYTFLILGLLFLKRVALVNCIFLFILSIFLSPVKTKISLRKIVYVLVIIIVIVLTLLLFLDNIKQTDVYKYGSTIIDNLFARFEDDSFTDYDRANEATLVLNNSSKIEKIFGYGLGSYAVIDGHLYPTLHTGIFNYLYKGGIFYLGFWIFLFIKFILLFLRKNKLSNYSLVCLMVAFSAILSSFYEFGFTHTIIPIGYATPIAYLVRIAKKEINSDKNLL